MSIDDVFDSFIEEEKENKTAPEAKEETKEPSAATENESVPTPEGEDETRDEAEEEAPGSSKEDDADDFFEPFKEEPIENKPAVEEDIEEKAAGETLVEEAPASGATAEADEDLFVPAKETPSSDKPTEDKSVEVEAAEEAPAEVPAKETLIEVDDEFFEPAGGEQPHAETPSEIGADRAALIRVKSSPIVIPAISANAMREQMKLFQDLKASILDKNKDIATIQGKPYVKRSGWRKMALVFNISDEILKQQKEEKGDDFEWRHWVRAWAPNGRSVVGVGGCSSKERDFAHIEHDVFCVSHTRAKNRALSDLIGSGEVSWEELRGFG
ncbi:hypothetical protein KKF32_05350 [Patescibacteria group bacterium]|nr:hypothetical protein [Patescibacteria group bacterium]